MINLSDRGRERYEPWPSDPVQLMLWLVRSPADPWVPTPAQLEKLRTERTARANPMPKVIPSRPDKKRPNRTAQTINSANPERV